MYWLYLAIFVLIILTPKIIQEGSLFLHEEDVESLIIFCFGVLAFTLYLAKEKALLQIFQEKLHLQKKTNIITKDLSDSYSYIGGMNRKFDIVKDLIFRLPKDTVDAIAKQQPETYQSILQAVRLLSKAETAVLHFVDTRTKKIVKSVDGGSSQGNCAAFDAEMLLASKRIFWEENECVVVRAPLQAKNIFAYIIFPKVTNQVEDVEMFKILASQALLLYFVDRADVPLA